MSHRSLASRGITRRSFLKVGAGSLAATVLAACGGAAVPTAQAPAAGPTATTAPAIATGGGGELKLGYAQGTSFSHFMHFRHYAGSEAIYSKRFANAKLLTMNNDFSGFIPDLAEEYGFSDDGLTLTFKLREGLTWHDGEPFTAEDVRVSFHMISLPTGSYTMGLNFAPYIHGFAEYIAGEADSISGLRVVDDYTVVFDLKEAFDQNLLYLAFNGVCIGPAHIVGEYMDRTKSETLLQSEWATTAKHVGIGPFRVVEYVPDQYAIYEPFENYYRGKPKLDRLIYQPFKDGQTLVAALENKEINVGARVPLSEYKRLQAMDYLKFHLADSPSLVGANMNNRKEYLNTKVRQGLLHALDRDAIVKAVYGDFVVPIHTPLRAAGIPDSPNLKKYDYNPELARQLLEEGGWDFANRKIRWATSAVPADTLYYDSINGYWAEVGVQAEFQVYGQDSTGVASDPWDYDLISSAWPLGYPSQIATHYDIRTCTRWCNGNNTARLMELFDATRYSMPQEDYQALFWEMQELIADEAMFLWLAQTPDVWGMGTGVQGLRPVYTPYEFTYNDWELEKVTVES